MVIQDVADELAVWVDDGHASAGVDIPRDHVAHQGALAGTGRTKDREVLPPRVGRDREDAVVLLKSIFVFGADRDVVEHGGMTVEF